MAGPLLYDMVWETSTTTGTGTLTLAGAKTGYRSFSVVGNSNTCFYTARHQTADEWEVGVGTYTTAGTTLARTTILASSNSDLAVDFSAGTKDVILSGPAALLGITGLTAETTLASNDEVAFYDASVTAIRKATLTNLMVLAVLLSGRSGGQVIYGGTGSGDDLTLYSTSHSTKGVVQVLDNLYLVAGLIADAAVTPAQITANQNDYTPAGAGTKLLLNLDTDASRDITGLLIGASNTDGQIVIIRNIGSFNIVLKNQSASSTAANRFALGADVTIATLQCAILQYYGTGSRWMMLAGPGSSGSGTAASQAEQEAGSEAAKYVAPATQQFHQSAAKAWIAFDASSGTPTTLSDYNCDSVGDSGVGNFDIAFTTDFADTNYALAGFSKRHNDTVGAQSVVTARSSDTRTAAVMEIRVVSGSADNDTPLVCLVAFGDHA